MKSPTSKNNPLCGAMTRKGMPCKLPATANGLCWIHIEEKTSTPEDNLLDFKQREHPVAREEEFDKSTESSPEFQFKRDDKDVESGEFIERPEDSAEQQECVEEKAVSDNKVFGPDQDTEESEIYSILEDIEILEIDEDTIDVAESELKLEIEETQEPEDRSDKEPDESDTAPDQDTEESEIYSILEDIEILEIDEDTIDVAESELKLEIEETQEPEDRSDKGPDESDTIPVKDIEQSEIKSILEILGIDEDTKDQSESDLESISENLEVDEDASDPSPLEIQQKTEETWKFDNNKDFEADYDSEEGSDFSTTYESKTHAEETVKGVIERHRESDADIKEESLSGHIRFWKKRISIPFPALLLATILVFVFFNADTFHLLAPILAPKVQDAGNLRISPFAIKSKFVENSDYGQLFVINGLVKNEYDKPRSFISVKGKLYTKDNYSKTETVYCGNVLSSEELSNLGLVDIKMRLSNRFGKKRSNINVKTGAILPFMIVFSNLPDNLENLDRFSIEIVRSSPS